MKEIAENFSCSGHLDEGTLRELKQKGVTTIINARYDDEESGQTDSDEIKCLVESLGMKYFHIPVKPLNYSQQDIDQFHSALPTGNDKAHGFCRTGTRALHLWALAKAKNTKVQDIISMCADQQCDLSAISQMMKKIETQ
ncbi:TIGR01244 family sulfur transferase [Aliiglaciecola sp. LCG003]|uniref:TIGR01244 family sulfur transferase n=1 Tax=Aliiglaciecola sp. LCG003 TaxID=3053655 RepID=UPI0025729407|nr:TIGR01244 family sulfur transferase [Aliiglaciecola sp. LCG003]WJG10799.1 TIGR01244 family sulfur transferase [Aliiglaciecola sp. LCG003]